MKTPRVKDFDPEAKVPELKSSLADMPSISKPRFRNDQGVQSNPISTAGITKPAETSSEEKNEGNVDNVIRDVPPVRPVLPVPPKRVMKQRWPIDLYQDQYDSLKQLAAEERMQGGVGSMSAMIREALDKLIAERRKK
jgi:hypothetical protein